MRLFVAGFRLAGALLLLASAGFSQNVVINEIMYHPLQPVNGHEPVEEEFIELFNRGPTNVNLAGWRFTKGVELTFPSYTLPPGAYAVVVGCTSPL